ncbi:hypothetical protein I4B30_000846 [Enterobacter hormaechei]|nr:hypothetical protein [Enterobacter hormaechei]
MITLTKEWLLKTIAELEEERDATPGAVNEDAAMALAAMNLALASLEAEPMAFIGQRMLEELTDGSRSCGRVWSEVTDKLSDENRIPLYTAPPAPASVPDAIHSQGEKSVGDDYYALGWNACRAAMLKGAEPVTTANKLPFEQWLSQQTGTIGVECGCVMTEVFFHWLRVAYEAGNYPVIPDGWVLVPIEPTYQMCEAMGLPWESPRFPDRYKAMIAAAPHFREISNSSTKHFRENAETSTKCWCHTCRPVTNSDMRFVVCPDCGNKRCPHANDHRNACTGSNEPGQEGSAYPATPQQEISHALAKGMERYGDAMQELAKKEEK